MIRRKYKNSEFQRTPTLCHYAEHHLSRAACAHTKQIGVAVGAKDAQTKTQNVNEARYHKAEEEKAVGECEDGRTEPRGLHTQLR